MKYFCNFLIIVIIFGTKIKINGSRVQLIETQTMSIQIKMLVGTEYSMSCKVTMILNGIQQQKCKKISMINFVTTFLVLRHLPDLECLVFDKSMLLLSEKNNCKSIINKKFEPKQLSKIL